jgi:hypothetical protein
MVTVMVVVALVAIAMRSSTIVSHVLTKLIITYFMHG